MDGVVEPQLSNDIRQVFNLLGGGDKSGGSAFRTEGHQDGEDEQ